MLENIVTYLGKIKLVHKINIETEIRDTAQWNIKYFENILWYGRPLHVSYHSRDHQEKSASRQQGQNKCSHALISLWAQSSGSDWALWRKKGDISVNSFLVLKLWNHRRKFENQLLAVVALTSSIPPGMQYHFYFFSTSGSSSGSHLVFPTMVTLTP